MIDKATITEFFAQTFPQATMLIDEVGDGTCVIRQPIRFEHLRPGGTVSGPVLMAVADVAIYVALLSKIGLVELAVTTNLNTSFLRRPAADKDVIARCRLLKLGNALAVGDVLLYSEGSEEPVAHAVGTYSIPPDAR